MRFISLLVLVSISSSAFGLSAQPMVTPRMLAESLDNGLAPARLDTVHDQVLRLFGKQNLLKGKAGAKIDGTTVAWAVMEMAPARVVQNNGVLIGEMIRLGDDGLQVLVRKMSNFTEFNYRIEVGGNLRVGGNVRIEHFELGQDSQRQAQVPQGKLEQFEWSNSAIFPDTVRAVTVYLPAQYRAGDEACLMVWQDGSRHVDPNGVMRASIVFDNLIHKNEMPVTVGVFVDPGRRVKQKPHEKAANRGFEYDSLGDSYVRFLLEEVLPEVQKRYGVKFRPEPEAWAIAGGSSGGICSFTAAWERSDRFRKVLSWVGTFVDIRGGHAYPYLLRITEKKPIRVYLLDGANDLDNQFGSWPLANKMMEASLKYMGYDYRMDWTECFHGSKGMAAYLPEALRWLWRDVR